MAYQDIAIFQRTDLGRAEIRDKRHGLTQSERLVLIIVDGVSSYAQLRVKLKSLVKERFDRALRSLSDKGLLYEVMFPLDNQVPDFVEADAMDRFLRQEDSDPVSLLAFQPEEELSDSVLRANGLINGDVVDDVEEAEPVIPVDPYPSLILNTIDRLEEPVIYTKDKVVKIIDVPVIKENMQVDFYLPLLPPEGMSPVLATNQVVKSVDVVTPSATPVTLTAVASSNKPVLKFESELGIKPNILLKNLDASQSEVKNRTKVIQKFPEPKPTKTSRIKKKKSLADYLDSRYSLALLILGVILAIVPVLIKFLS
ncbi:hypothetical protein RGU72_15750 [Undibacterium sp. 5I1]|uniref:hypothetical protein n=1 Tax=unclassified Undibacterium TaxID=2630295 RepID=UPI002AB41CFD|nr:MULTISPECIES: hypothetical protein [unclassified Undibacterium]MDY7539708.1 hypothetical protein [Undibacterium sp. 5I1]MEB0230862.1 hypothetical protein [Undibacterium sp. 10I3]MEB0257483.1 hypothetical protein [Undibacterium sp. 5I1]